MDAGIVSVSARIGAGEFCFSSRRRHTRSYGDWSSDVCSSDLLKTSRPATREPVQPSGSRHLSTSTSLPLKRSEERRVGKEWRIGKCDDHSKDKLGQRDDVSQQHRSAATPVVVTAPDLGYYIDE